MNPKFEKAGAPQGSVSGLILFILFMNDIVPSNKNSKIVLFADDASLAITATKSDFRIGSIFEDELIIGMV